MAYAKSIIGLFRSSYETLRKHPYIRSQGERDREEFVLILNRTLLHSDDERTFAAVVREIFSHQTVKALRQARRNSLCFCFGPQVVRKMLGLPYTNRLDFTKDGTYMINIAGTQPIEAHNRDEKYDAVLSLNDSAVAALVVTLGTLP
jgi:hypothetical protein